MTPTAALERAIRAAERNWRAMATDAGWPAWAVDLLARPNAEINVGPAWRVFKQEVSAWHRPEGDP